MGKEQTPKRLRGGAAYLAKIQDDPKAQAALADADLVTA
jgi:hypothetical protein